jgi:hypothetical protein
MQNQKFTLRNVPHCTLYYCRFLFRCWLLLSSCPLPGSPNLHSCSFAPCVLPTAAHTAYSPVQLTQMSRSSSVNMKAISVKVQTSLLVQSLHTLACHLLEQCAAMTRLSSITHRDYLRCWELSLCSCYQVVSISHYIVEVSRSFHVICSNMDNDRVWAPKICSQ